MERLINIKNSIFLILGAIGGFIMQALGGGSTLLTALIICAIADYLTGFIVASIFKNSPKTETGALQSNAGFQGLIKKVYLFIIIAIVNQIDIVMVTNGFLRNAAIIGFLVNELLSLIENTGLMGIKWSPVVINAIDILKKQSEKELPVNKEVE